MKVDLDTWAQMAKDLGLRTINLPDSDGKVIELVIFKAGDLDRGWLWIGAHRLTGCDAKVQGDIDPGEAVALLGRLHRNDAIK